MIESPAVAAPLIAVVDDDDSLCRSVARFLRASGYRCVTYGSAEAFLDDEGRSLVDCLVVDVQLDGMSGTELLQRLPSAGLRMPVVLMTARSGGPEDGTDDLGHGAVTIRKSDSGEQLLRVVRDALDPFLRDRAQLGQKCHK